MLLLCRVYWRTFRDTIRSVSVIFLADPDPTLKPEADPNNFLSKIEFFFILEII